MRFLTLISIIFFSYNVNAQICPFCGVPSGFSITTTDTQADISWNNVSNALYYDLRYKEDDGNSGWIYVDDIYTNSAILTSLYPDTEYEFEVRSYCSTGFSYWSDDEEFETLNTIFYDCAGVANGTAFIDNCNDCVGGNTTLNACTQDCNGDYGGNANIDDCGNCTIPSENCIAFSPNTSTSLSNTNCGEMVDLSIMFEQDPYEPDIQNSLFWSNAGSFVFQNLSVGDTIGYGYLNTDGGNIMISTIFIINSFVSSNQIVINSIDTATNNNVGNFTIANLNPGIYITATSPGDNNNVTDGNYSMGVFQNIFLNPTAPTTIEFTANTNSELGDSDMQYEYISIDCFSEIQTNANLETSIYPNPSNGSFNVLSSHESNLLLIAANGQVIFEKKLEKGSNFLNVDLRSGLYLIQIESEKENFIQKISVY